MIEPAVLQAFHVFLQKLQPEVILLNELPDGFAVVGRIPLQARAGLIYHS